MGRALHRYKEQSSLFLPNSHVWNQDGEEEMSKTILGTMLALTHMFNKKSFADSRGEDIVIPVDTKGVAESAEKSRLGESVLSKQELKRKRGKKQRSNRGKKR